MGRDMGRGDYRNFIFDASHGVVFAYVPKVACSNWKCVMRHMAGLDDWLNTRLAHDRAAAGLVYLDQHPDATGILADPGVQKFACVRNPYTRLLSAYLNKIAQRLPGQPAADKKDHFSTILTEIDAFRRAALDPAQHPQVSFEVFLRWLAAGHSYFCRDEHWRPQADLLQIDTVEFTHIGRFETLTSDAADILARMGADLTFPSPADIRFAPSGTDEKFARYTTAPCRALVARLYARDFKAFGYDMGKNGPEPNDTPPTAGRRSRLETAPDAAFR